MPPCECCGGDPEGDADSGGCICPECHVCEEYGNPECYKAHGLTYTQAQLDGQAKLAEYYRQQADADRAEAEYWANQHDEEDTVITKTDNTPTPAPRIEVEATRTREAIATLLRNSSHANLSAATCDLLANAIHAAVFVPSHQALVDALQSVLRAWLEGRELDASSPEYAIVRAALKRAGE